MSPEEIREIIQKINRGEIQMVDNGIGPQYVASRHKDGSAKDIISKWPGGGYMHEIALPSSW